MALLTIRQVDEEIVRLLKIRAAHNNRSAEAEVREILERALRPDRDTFWARATALREVTRGRGVSDSTHLVRRERDRWATGDAGEGAGGSD